MVSDNRESTRDIELGLTKQSLVVEYDYATHSLGMAGAAVHKSINFPYSEYDYKDAMTSSLLKKDQRVPFPDGELSPGGASKLGSATGACPPEGNTPGETRPEHSSLPPPGGTPSPEERLDQNGGDVIAPVWRRLSACGLCWGGLQYRACAPFCADTRHVVFTWYISRLGYFGEGAICLALRPVINNLEERHHHHAHRDGELSTSSLCSTLSA